MANDRKPPPFPKWWQARIQESLSTFNPRLMLSPEELHAEMEGRIERELDYLTPDLSRLSKRDPHYEQEQKRYAQIQDQHLLVVEILKRVFEIEELNNQIVYYLGGSLMGQLQGTHTGEVRVRLSVRVRQFQQRRERLENEVLAMWEEIGAGFKER